MPEYGYHGLHYHGFIQLKVRPNLQQYDTEWKWMKSALSQTFTILESYLSNSGKTDVKFYQRSYAKEDDVRRIIYSLKEYGTGASRYDQDPMANRFSQTIVTWIDWEDTAHTPLTKRTTKKVNSYRLPKDMSSLKEFLI